MNDRDTVAGRPPGRTGGSPQRPPHQLDEAITELDLSAEVAALRDEPAWQQGDRNARTFFKESDLRVLLTVLRQGAMLREHRVPGPATVQLLSGRIRLGLSGRAIELSAGRLAILERDVPHDVEALEESAFLISIAWEGGARGDASRA